MLAETLLHRQAWKESPSLIMTVLVKDGQASLWHHARQFVNQQRRIADEGDHPSAPGEIVIGCGQIVAHQIDLVNFHIVEQPCTAGCFHGTDKVLRSLEGDYFACRSDNLSEVDSRVTRTGAHVEYAFADCNGCTLPAIQNDRKPDTMLQSEPGYFLFMRAKNIVAIVIDRGRQIHYNANIAHFSNLN